MSNPINYTTINPRVVLNSRFLERLDFFKNEASKNKQGKKTNVNIKVTETANKRWEQLKKSTPKVAGSRIRDLMKNFQKDPIGVSTGKDVKKQPEKHQLKNKKLTENPTVISSHENETSTSEKKETQNEKMPKKKEREQNSGLSHKPGVPTGKDVKKQPEEQKLGGRELLTRSHSIDSLYIKDKEETSISEEETSPEEEDNKNKEVVLQKRKKPLRRSKSLMVKKKTPISSNVTSKKMPPRRRRPRPVIRRPRYIIEEKEKKDGLFFTFFKKNGKGSKVKGPNKGPKAKEHKVKVPKGKGRKGKEPKIKGHRHNKGPKASISLKEANKKKANNKIFGGDLKNLPKDDAGLPLVFTQLIDLLKDTEKGLKTQGLYRIPANNADLNALKKIVNDKGIDLKSAIEETDVKVTVHMIGALIKKFVGELKEGLIPLDCYRTFFSEKNDFSAIKDDNKENALVNLFQELPEENQRLLKALIWHLVEVSRIDNNLMDAHSLGIVLAPRIFDSKDILDLNLLLKFTLNFNSIIEAYIKITDEKGSVDWLDR